jgi:hypothetical protein
VSGRCSTFALLLLAGACATALARKQVPSLWGALQPGSHHAGFREADNISIWYPAAADGTQLRFRDYAGTLDDLEALLHEHHVSDRTMVDLFDTPMYAHRDARASTETSGLVIVALTSGQTAADLSILAEFLASHDYIVAALPPSVATAKLRTSFSQARIDGAQWLHNVNFSSLASASGRFPELAASTKGDAREMTSLATRLLEFLDSHRGR